MNPTGQNVLAAKPRLPRQPSAVLPVKDEQMLKLCTPRHHVFSDSSQRTNSSSWAAECGFSCTGQKAQWRGLSPVKTSWSNKADRSNPYLPQHLWTPNSFLLQPAGFKHMLTIICVFKIFQWV